MRGGLFSLTRQLVFAGSDGLVKTDRMALPVLQAAYSRIRERQPKLEPIIGLLAGKTRFAAIALSTIAGRFSQFVRINRWPPH